MRSAGPELKIVFCSRFVLAWLALTALFGCGGSFCLGDEAFCNAVFNPVANAGPDQTMVSGALVTLDGSKSEGSISSFSWTQTGGPAVALVNADKAVATFIAPFVASTVSLSFRLTVVGESNRADTDSTSIIVQP